jgi:eukaryotic-like serine/threonine-protein kinase
MDAERWRRISALYHEASAREGGDRAAYLAQACAGDETLQRDVESLLDSQRMAEGVLAGPEVALAAGRRGDSQASMLSGRRLGVYLLHERIGAGGMGEVYRAQDTRLGRDVAIKILPREFTDDGDRLSRFEREARLLAALNHPNIGVIYSVEDGSSEGGVGLRALVLELVEGETLAERIRRGAVPVREVLEIARQIVDALDAVHQKGIIHRDLKPANIKITPTGVVKVLDFGLGKVANDDGPDVTQLPTAALGGTRMGVILGTAAYMSPEQARGLTVDKRTDIWAFGCVLYETLTARAVFAGETFSDTIAAILGHEPDWTALPAPTPASLRRLLQRCLHKDPKRRLRDIGDARADIDESRVELDAPVPAVASDVRASDIEFQRLTDFVGKKESPAVSPDGKIVAFSAVVGGKRQIWIRMLAGGAALQVTRDDVDHEQPRWAPDSSTLIYFTPPAAHGADGTIWEISALGGPPRPVASAIGGGDISHDGRRIAVFQAAGEEVALMSLARDGSRAERAALLPAGDTYTSPRWSPDDRSIAFQRASSTGWDHWLEVVTMVDGTRRGLTPSEWLNGFCWLPDGSGFVYSSSRGSTSRYPPVFNLRAIERDGRRDRQLTFGDQSYVEPDAQSAGKLLAGRIRSQSEIWKYPVSGSPVENTRDALRITRQTGQAQTPSVNPDDTEIVYLSDNGGHGNLWVTSADGSLVRQITFERDPDVSVGVPSWSPAGNIIVFVMDRGGQAGLWAIHPDGGGLRQIIASGWMPCWSGDGRWLYYHPLLERTEGIQKVLIDGGTPIVVRREVGARQPAVSADGSALYYAVSLRSTIFGHWGADHEIRCARPEDGASETIGHVSGRRVPIVPGMLHMALSPDGRWLAVPLMDGATTNIWALPTTGGPMRPLTDFGERSIVIARSVSWSRDSRYIYAAVSEAETDIVLLGGLIS